MMLVMLLRVYPHRASLKNMPGLATVGNLPKYAHRGQAYFSSLPGVDIYTQSNITSITIIVIDRLCHNRKLPIIHATIYTRYRFYNDVIISVHQVKVTSFMSIF